ncbi:MAG TPA: glycosyltransferase [Candidatus Saccharimonadales bacterium]|nr:glycosyltransferase [Candidatus Saccharimonadales bacterium]
MTAPAPKVAIVCDWLTTYAGAEKVVVALAKAFPGAPIYTSVFAMKDEAGRHAFANFDIRTTYLQKLPAKLRGRHQLFPLQRANAFRKLDLSEFDVIISSASAEAKAVRKRPDALHICYCHTPTRYYWSHYKEYLAEPGFGKTLNTAVRVALPALVKIMRRIDLRAAAGVDYFIANSSAVAERIRTYYNRDSTIIYPPITMHHFKNLNVKGERHGFVASGRQVPYKRHDLAIAACNELKEPLTVFGEGPEHARLVAMAGPTITFKPYSAPAFAKALSQAEAFMHPQEEDFGIVQIESLAAGTPVVAYAKGGATDTIKEGETGVLFNRQTVSSMITAIKRLQATTFDYQAIKKRGEHFNEERFIAEVQAFVAEKIAAANKPA